MCKKCWLTVVLLLVVVVGMSYSFIYQGKTIEGSDGRKAVVLNEAEKDLLLSEMRGFLISVQQITTAVSAEDMKKIADSSRAMGTGAAAAVPATLMAKLPLEFKQLGLDTHKQFDMIALDAEQLGDPQHSLKQLGHLMQNCLACHATYQVQLEQAK
ncbi:MAG: hypothetical protein OEX03_12320 [Gammaproteobacteria bacterium]|nr:hypothetical protein [Gammaproteobacteria bacterium]